MADVIGIQVLYFSSLKTQAGVAEASLQINAQTVATLYQMLSAQHGFTLNQEALRPAINHHFCDWQTLLQDGDVVAFIPPVSGG